MTTVIFFPANCSIETRKSDPGAIKFQSEDTTTHTYIYMCKEQNNQLYMENN